MATLTFKSPAAMQDWGRRLGRSLKNGDVIALVGNLGAGKTTLVQGLAAGWGYRRRANSPTFALVNEYPGSRGTLLHMDVYRLTDKELDVFPLEEYFDAESVCVIEWANRVKNRWPGETLELRFQAPRPTLRRIEPISPSPAWKKRLARL